MFDYITENIIKVVDRSQAIYFIPKIFGSFAIIVFAIFLHRVTSKILKRLLLKTRVNEAFATHLIDNVYKFLIIVFAFVGILHQFGIDLKTAATGVGVLGIALGFAAQDSLSNIIAGFMIFFDKPFLVGDYITIGEHYGRVEMITMRSTRIRTQDNKYVVIPNQKIINEVLVDHSTNGETRLNIPVGVAYKESIEKARAVIIQAIENIDGIIPKPGPDVVVKALGPSGVELLARVWIRNARREQEIFFKTAEAIKAALQKEKIEIPYPHMKILRDTQDSSNY